jgi:eukaryotic-like serine/threonine-protein kinase
MSPITIEELNAELPKKWEIESELGKGGQGSVYKGTFAGKPAAIKVFHRDDDGRITRELEAAKKIQSKYVCSVLSWCSIGLRGMSVTVVAYELHNGGDLSRWVGAKPEKGIADLATVGMHVSLAIVDLWAQKIVHRDIKPANIVASGDGRFVLVDLAFARHLGKSSLTETGYTCGTRQFFSPEQSAAWKNLTYASDIFTLGVSLFNLATARFPMRDDVLAGKAGASLAVLRPDLAPMAQLLDSMMVIEPYQRPFAEDVAAAFNDISQRA